MSIDRSTPREPKPPATAGVEAAPDETRPGLSHRRRSRALRVTRLLFTPVAILFLLYFGWQSRSELMTLFASARPAHLLIAILAWSMMNLLGPLLATVVFRGLGYDIGYSEAARIHIKNLPARYLPGGIWHTVGRIVDYRRTGIENRDLATFVFLESILGLAIALVIGGSLIGWFRGLQGWGMVVTAGAATGLVITLLLPFLGRLRAPDYVTGRTIPAYVAAVTIVALSWCVAAGGFSAFVLAFPDLSPVASPLELAGVYLVSWAVGFVAVFAPQGIGVFELVAAEMIRGSYSLANTAVLLATLRLVILVADSVVWTCGLLVPRLIAWKRTNPRSAHVGRPPSRRT